LGQLITVRLPEDCVEQRDVLNNKLLDPNIDPIEDIERVLDEEEDAGAKDFLGSSGEDEGEREQSGARRSKGGGKRGVEECHFTPHVNDAPSTRVRLTTYRTQKQP